MSEFRIVVDTREKNPLMCFREVVRRKLQYGDYAIEGKEGLTSVEYKSSWDWASCNRSKAGRARLVLQTTNLIKNVRNALLVIMLPPPEHVLQMKFPGLKRQFLFDAIASYSKMVVGERVLTVYPVYSRADASELIDLWLDFQNRNG